MATPNPGSVGAGHPEMSQLAPSGDSGGSVAAGRLDELSGSLPDLADGTEAHARLSCNGDSARVEDDVPTSSAAHSHRKRKRGKRARTGPDYRTAPLEESPIKAAIKRFAQTNQGPVFYPHIGLTFNSSEEAKQYYNLYSWEQGFGVRTGRGRSNTSPYRSRLDIVCSCEGRNRNASSGSIRTKCPAHIRLHRHGDHSWFISRIDDDHNHPLSSSYGETKQCPSHGSIAPSTKDFIRKLRENNISLGRTCNIVGVKDVTSSTGMQQENVRSICSSLARDNMADDLGKTMGLLEAMKETDPGLEVKFQDRQNVELALFEAAKTTEINSHSRSARMTLTVHFQPKDLIEPLLSGLGEGCTDVFEVTDPQRGYQYEVSYESANQTANGPEKKLAAFGEFDHNAESALRGALIATMVAIRQGYGTHIADYSYTKIASKHPLFNRMVTQLTTLCNDYNTIYNHAKCLHPALDQIVEVLRHAPRTNPSVAALGVLTIASHTLVEEIKESSTVVRNFSKPGKIDQDVRSFLHNMPPPIDSEASLELLLYMYEKVMQSAYGAPPTIRPQMGESGEFISSVHIEVDQVTIQSEPKPDLSSAIAEAIIKSLAHVETTFQAHIKDITYHLWTTMNDRMRSFATDVSLVMTDARQLRSVARRCFRVLTEIFGLDLLNVETLHLGDISASTIRGAAARISIATASIESSYVAMENKVVPPITTLLPPSIAKLLHTANKYI